MHLHTSILTLFLPHAYRKISPINPFVWSERPLVPKRYIHSINTKQYDSMRWSEFYILALLSKNLKKTGMSWKLHKSDPGQPDSLNDCLRTKGCHRWSKLVNTLLTFSCGGLYKFVKWRTSKTTWQTWGTKNVLKRMWACRVSTLHNAIWSFHLVKSSEGHKQQ